MITWLTVYSQCQVLLALAVLIWCYFQNKTQIDPMEIMHFASKNVSLYPQITVQITQILNARFERELFSENHAGFWGNN